MQLQFGLCVKKEENSLSYFTKRKKRKKTERRYHGGEGGRGGRTKWG